MDGAPYLRKVDLKLYKSYQELSDALGKMFSSFTIGIYNSPTTIRIYSIWLWFIISIVLLLYRNELKLIISMAE